MALEDRVTRLETDVQQLRDKLRDTNAELARKELRILELERKIERRVETLTPDNF